MGEVGEPVLESGVLPPVSRAHSHRSSGGRGVLPCLSQLVVATAFPDLWLYPSLHPASVFSWLSPPFSFTESLCVSYKDAS